MRDWVPFHIELCSDGKRGLPRAVRFIFMELSLKVKKGRGSIKLPVGMSDLDALHDLVGGSRREVVDALRLLTSPLPGDEKKLPMVVLDGPEFARTLRIPSWVKWAAAKEMPGASNDRRRRHDDRRRAQSDDNHEFTNTYDDETSFANDQRTEDERPANGGRTTSERRTNDQRTVYRTEQDKTGQIQPEPLEVLPETSEPPASVDPEAAARAEDSDQNHLPEDGHVAPLGVDLPWLTSKLAAPLFQPLIAAADQMVDLAGRIAMSGARREDVERAIDDYPLKARRGRDDPAEIAHGLLNFVGGAIAARRKVVAKPLGPAERETMDLWLRLWSREHKGAMYPVSGRDHDHIRKLFARAKDRAKALGLPHAREVLEHYIAGYLRIDDKRLVTERYPLALLESRLAAIGEYQPKKPKALHVEIAPTDQPPQEPSGCGAPTTFKSYVATLGQGGVDALPRRVAH